MPLIDALRLLQHLGDDPFGAAHLPQDVGVDTALAAGDVPRAPGLGQRALNRVVDQFLMPLPPGAAMIDLRDRPPVCVETIGIDGTERANTAGQRPVAGGNAIGDGNTLAAFYQRENIDPAHSYCIDCAHARSSL